MPTNGQPKPPDQPEAELAEAQRKLDQARRKRIRLLGIRCCGVGWRGVIRDAAGRVSWDNWGI